MKRILLSASDWMTVHEIQDAAKQKKTVEITITGIIGGSFWDDSPPDAVNTREKMRAELKAIAELKADLIIVNIDSPGGSVAHGLSIHDLLATNAAEKEVRIIGMTASIATVIAQAGATRKMSENALFLVHHASMGLMGGFNSSELESVVNDLKAVDARIQAVYVKRSGKSAEEMLSLLRARINNSLEQELFNARDEQNKITHLRLKKLIL